MEDFCGGPFWDYDLAWASERPDLTFCFQQTALVYIPCAILWVFALLEIYYIKTSRYRDIPWNLYNITKSIVLFSLIALTFIEMSLAIDMRESQGLYPVHIVTPIIKIVSFILAAFLMYFNQRRGIQSSALLFIFWIFLCIFAIPELRTLVMNYEPVAGDTMQWENFRYPSYIVYFSLVAAMFVLNCFADQSPRHTTFHKSAKPSPELSASYVRKMFFQWFDAMTWKGFRKPLDVNDMYDINPEDTSRELNPVFDKYWYESVEKGRKKAAKASQSGKKTGEPTTERKETHGSILPAMVKAFGGPFWFAGLLKLAMDLLQFATPFLLNELILFVGTPAAAMWKGILFAFALFGVYVLTSLINGQYFYKTFLVGFRIRASLINSIFRKAMRISTNAKKDTTVGEIVNLMAVDAQRFFELTSYLHVLWSAPLVIGLALFFLYQILGPSVFAGLGVMLLMIPLTGVIATQLRNLQVVQMKVKDERVKVMNEVLNGMKVLKLYAWEPSFEASVLVARDKEIAILRKMAVLNSVTYFVWSMAPFLVTLASFATFVLVDENNVLTPQIAFVSLTLFNILRFPMAMFPMMITLVMQTWVSITRINKFMNNEELDMNNVTHNKSELAIEIQDGNFTWGGEHTTLKNINVRVKKANLTAIVGKVGSGKSSLVSALLGEMDKLTGSVNTDGRIAFVPQQAWIQNATLQDNVTFGRKFDKERYDKVIVACALKADIDMLPGGDQTEIGEKGINLSGGQKQRVALARAVYSDADIYLLDDPLSAVDAHVGKHIFDNVVGPNGMLANKTRFLVTHGVSFLPFMDEILVMLDGEISESGSYKSLIAQKGAFSEFLMEHLAEMDDEDSEEMNVLKEALKNEKPELLERTTSLISEISDKISRNGSVRKRGSRKTSNSSAGETAAKEMKAKMASKLIEKEESATGGVDFSVYIQYFKSIGLWTGSISIVFYLMMQGFSVYSSIWLSDWSENPDAATDMRVRNVFLGVYAALGMGQALTLFAGSLILAFGCLGAAKFLHNKLLSQSMRLPMSFFDTTPLGRIMNRFSKDVDMVDNTLPMTIRMWLNMLLNVLAVFVVITFSTPWFAAVIVPLAIIYYFIQKFYVATSRQLKRLESVTRSPIYSHFGESITGQSTIRAYGEEARFTLESETRVDYNQMTAYPSIIANRWLGLRLEIVGAVVVLAAALLAVLGRDTISPAIAGLSINYALQVSQVLNFLVRMTAEVETNIVAIERMEEYASMPQEAAWKKGEVNKEWPQTGKVQFENLELRYREGLDLVLKGISLLVNGGEKVGIVGRTGAGKSSLTLALFRIIEAAGGKIEIDDLNIATMGLHSLRSRLTIIPQDPVLFSGTLRKNIDPFAAYTDDDIWRVLENSHLKSFVKGQTAGLLYEVSEGGENLSVGQRQLICLARALLRKTKVLVLDEATAAVDLDTDDLIQKTIRVEFKDCTVLTIAHRLNTILDSDKVVVLDKGMIVEYDTPDNLLADPNTIFHGMAKDAGLVGNTGNSNGNGTNNDNNDSLAITYM